jgi:predicted nucleic acid-binding protein
MSGIADANLVLAVINPKDALHRRGTDHVREHRSVQVPFSVGIELLLIAKKHGHAYLELLRAVEACFEVERRAVLFTAAEALDTGEVRTVFDAVHLAEALHRGERLHTADEDLWATAFPTTAF